MDCPKTKAACLYPVNCDDYDACLRSLGYPMSSQPNPTPQVPAVPTLEQLAERVAKLEEFVAHMNWANQMKGPAIERY